MPNFSWSKFKEQLDEVHNFPTYYTFKFIVPRDRKEEVAEIFHGEKLSINASKNGKFFSITAKIYMHSSEDVILIYKKASKIEGIVAL